MNRDDPESVILRRRSLAPEDLCNLFVATQVLYVFHQLVASRLVIFEAWAFMPEAAEVKKAEADNETKRFFQNRSNPQNQFQRTSFVNLSVLCVQASLPRPRN